MLTNIRKLKYSKPALFVDLLNTVLTRVWLKKINLKNQNKFFFSLLGLELKAYTLSHSTSPVL
jgi:hypothetical protein